jgi:hypothetical protein
MASHAALRPNLVKPHSVRAARFDLDAREITLLGPMAPARPADRHRHW